MSIVPSHVSDNCSTWRALHERCRKYISYYSSVTAGQSYKHKLPELRHDLPEVYDFDILTLSELWLRPSVPNRLVSVDGYNLYRADRPAASRLAQGHGGVAILVKAAYSVTVLPTPVTGVEPSNLEIIWAKVAIKQQRQLLFASVYRHPTNTQRQVEADIGDFEMQLQHLTAQYPGATVVIAGDFNLCLLKNEPHRGAHLSRLLSTYNLHLANTTRATYRPAGTLLDILATNRPNAVVRRGVTRCHYGTPHDFTRIALRQVGTMGRRGATVECRAMSRIDDADFNWSLSMSDWSGVYRADCPDVKWAAFLAVFAPLLDSVAPLRRVRLPPPGAPRVTDATRELLARRRALLSPSAAGRAEYKVVNRQCRAAIRRDHAAYFADRLREAGPSQMWAVLRPVVGAGKSVAAVMPACTPDALNSYYVSVGPATAASVPAPRTALPVMIPRVLTCAFRLHTVTYDALYSLIDCMKRSAFAGLDGVSVDMFRRFFHGMGHVLLDIVNCSLETGLVPTAWKHALVTAIPKGANSSQPCNTRPISMLPGVMKIVERRGAVPGCRVL